MTKNKSSKSSSAADALGTSGVAVEKATHSASRSPGFATTGLLIFLLFFLRWLLRIKCWSCHLPYSREFATTGLFIYLWKSEKKMMVKSWGCHWPCSCGFAIICLSIRKQVSSKWVSIDLYSNFLASACEMIWDNVLGPEMSYVCDHRFVNGWYFLSLSDSTTVLHHYCCLL